MNKSGDKISVFMYLIVGMVIFFSKDVLIFGTNSNDNYSLFMYAANLLIFATLVLYSVLKKQVSISSNTIIILAGLIVLILLTCLIKDSGQAIKYFYECLMLLNAILVCRLIKIENFKIIFLNEISFLALLSVIAFLIKIVAPSILNLFPTVTNVTGYKFWNLIFTVVPYDMEFVSIRNYGIFREPGVFQGFLNLALMFFITVDKEQRKTWKFIFIILALATTFSTAGYIIASITILVYLFLSSEKIDRKKILHIVSVVAIFIAIFSLTLFQTSNEVFNKFNTDNSSFNARFASIFVNLHIAGKNLLIGSGYTYIENNFSAIANDLMQLSTGSNTNTILKMFSVHGLIYTLIFSIGIFKFFEKEFSTMYKWIFLILFVMITSNEDFIFNTIIYIIMFYGFMKRRDCATYAISGS